MNFLTLGGRSDFWAFLSVPVDNDLRIEAYTVLVRTGSAIIGRPSHLRDVQTQEVVAKWKDSLGL